MPRKAAPRYRADRDLWYCQVKGKRYDLVKGKANRKEADAEFHRLMVRLGSKETVAPERLTVAELFNKFLAFVDLQVERGELEPVTYEGYGRHLSSAAGRFGGLRCADLKPHHVQEWVDDQQQPREVPAKGGGTETRRGPWGPTTRSNAIVAVKRAFNWGRKQGFVDASPVAGMERPTPRRREVVPDPAAVAKLFGAAKGPLRDLLDALRFTGCRPGEVFGLSAAGVDLKRGLWTVKNKTRRKTGEPTRTVTLSASMVAMSRRLCAKHPDGPIFRNARGTAWNRNALGWRLSRIRTKLGLGPEVVAYAMRHLFATNLRARGATDGMIAAMMGHTDTKMVARVYGAHDDELRDAYRAELAKLDPPTGEGSGGE